MRIIAGEFRSRAIVAPKGTATRPTTDRARESIFNVLQNLIDIEDARVLDLFAGSGAFAFEAISRGAKSATLVEKDRNALLAAKANVEALKLATKVRVLAQDVFSYLKSPKEQFDIIFADAPYKELRSLNDLPRLIMDHSWLASDGICIIEHATGNRVTAPDGLEVIRELKVGEASFTIVRHASDVRKANEE